MPRTIPLRPVFRILPALTIPLAIALTMAPSPKPLAESPHAFNPRVLASVRPVIAAESSSIPKSTGVNSPSSPSTSVLTRTATPAPNLRPTYPERFLKPVSIRVHPR